MIFLENSLKLKSKIFKKMVKMSHFSLEILHQSLILQKPKDLILITL